MGKNISIIDKLDFRLGTVEVQGDTDLSALKQHYVRQVKEGSIDVDEIYFSGEFPTVYFKSVTDFEEATQHEILEIQRKIWNQGKVPFLYVESPTEVRVYNCYEKPVHKNQKKRSIDDILLYQTIIEDLNLLQRVFDKVSIETGRFWEERRYAKKLKNETRVEKTLIDNLKETRKKLKKNGLPINIIHDLLLRSLFILYLEDRKATTPEFYQQCTKVAEASSYFDVLDNIEGTYLLFEKLETAFNGNLSPITEEERELVTPIHLKQIKECFWSEIDNSGQLDLFDWRIFAFDVIPIQLLSEIYEHFLEEEDSDGKKQKGAFYTPLPLAQFVLNEVLPYPSKGVAEYNVKILDPTCGSGIFLVESLNRLLDRWEMAHTPKKLTFEIICQIVKGNIFGIEINSEAIKVTAFSLYLAMLNRLDPIGLWQTEQFPYLIYDPNEEDKNKQGSNLFKMSSLGSGPFEDIDFDLVVGNPPFKRGGLEGEPKNYLNKLKFAQELVLAFLHRVTLLAPNAKYGLICGSKPLLFNNLEPYKAFRKFLFQENYVEKIYNFSILRRVTQKEGGRNLFESAVNPISIVFYSKEIPDNPFPKIMYCAPKSPSIKNRMIDGIAIDKTDISYLPREECQKPDTKIWKIAMWGTERDFTFLNEKFRNNESLFDFFNNEKDNWFVGTGLHRPSDDKSYVEDLSEYPLIPTKKINRYFVDSNNLAPLGEANYRRIDKKLFNAPLILVKEGLKNNRFCAAYVSFKAVFLNAVYGINSTTYSPTFLKTLVGYLNSKFATYYLFFMSSTWGIERERVKLNELLSIPIIRFTDEYLDSIAKKVDKIIHLKSDPFTDKESYLQPVEEQLDILFYKGLGFSSIEIILIEDFFHSTLNFFFKKNKSPALFSSSIEENKRYAQYLCKSYNDYIDYDEDLTAWSIVFDLNSRVPLNVVVLYLNQEKEADSVIQLPQKEIGKILKQMEEYTYQEYAESIYYRRFFRYYDDDKVYIIKPNEKRFWSRSMAINDADEIVAEILKG